MSWFDFKSGIFLWFYPTTFILCGESYFLVLWCVDDRCDMADSDVNHGRSRIPGATDWGWSSTDWILDDRMIGRSGGACEVYSRLNASS
jgi:hypothetical protein